MEEHDEEMARMCQREENEEAIVQSVLQQSLVQASGVPQTAQEEKDHFNQACALSLQSGKTKEQRAEEIVLPAIEHLHQEGITATMATIDQNGAIRPSVRQGIVPLTLSP